jgi:hypothetical protein
MSGRDIVKCGLRASLQVCASRATYAKSGAERTQGTRADSNNRRLITTDLAHASYTCVLMLPLCGKLQKCGVAVKGNASVQAVIEPRRGQSLCAVSRGAERRELWCACRSRQRLLKQYETVKCNAFTAAHASAVRSMAWHVVTCTALCARCGAHAGHQCHGSGC